MRLLHSRARRGEAPAGRGAGTGGGGGCPARRPPRTATRTAGASPLHARHTITATDTCTDTVGVRDPMLDSMAGKVLRLRPSGPPLRMTEVGRPGVHFTQMMGTIEATAVSLAGHARSAPRRQACCGEGAGRKAPRGHPAAHPGGGGHRPLGPRPGRAGTRSRPRISGRARPLRGSDAGAAPGQRTGRPTTRRSRASETGGAAPTGQESAPGEPGRDRENRLLVVRGQRARRDRPSGRPDAASAAPGREGAVVAVPSIMSGGEGVRR